MSIILEYKCECRYYHNDDDTIQLLHVCTDHKIELTHDALANFSKRVKLGTSGNKSTGLKI